MFVIFIIFMVHGRVVGLIVISKQGIKAKNVNNLIPTVNYIGMVL